jgi:hypothetical protein
MIGVLLLLAGSTINSTTYSGWDWDHSMGNYLGTHAYHEAWYPIPGCEDEIRINIRCYPSQKVCFNINGRVLHIADGPLDALIDETESDSDYDEYLVIGTK